MQNDASTYWTFTCGILSSLPISSKYEETFCPDSFIKNELFNQIFTIL